MCRLCAEDEETWEYMLGESMRGEEGGNWWESLREILGQEGEGEQWLRELREKEKRKKEDRTGRGGSGRKSGKV